METDGLSGETACRGSGPTAERNREQVMNIVVWKSPKALRGILRLLFGMKREKKAEA